MLYLESNLLSSSFCISISLCHPSAAKPTLSQLLGVWEHLTLFVSKAFCFLSFIKTQISSRASPVCRNKLPRLAVSHEVYSSMVKSRAIT